MNTTSESIHMPTSTVRAVSVSTWNRKPEARNCTPRYGIEKNSATTTVRMRMKSPLK